MKSSLPSTVPASPGRVQPESRLRVSSEAAAAVVRAQQLAACQRRALHATIHGSAASTRAIAEDAGVGYSFLTSCTQESSKDDLPFRRLPAVLAACDDLSFARFLADLQHADVLPRPRVDGTADDVARGAATMKEVAEFIEALASAAAPGAAIDPEAFTRLEREGLEALAAIRLSIAYFRARVRRPLLEGV